MKDPKTAIDALLSTETTVGSLTIHPITLARYALLELVESPLVGGPTTNSVTDLIPTMYIMTSDKSALKSYNSRTVDCLLDDAMRWADDISVSEFDEVVNVIANKLADMQKVVPPGDEDEKKAEQARPTE